MTVLIPNKYSRIGNVTSLFIIKNCIMVYIYGEKVIGIMLLLCYIFTNLHWNNLKSNGIIRNLDITIVVTIFITGSFRAFMYDCFARYYICTAVTITAFISNEYLNSLTLYKSDFESMSNDYKKIVYYRSVIVHTFFLHIFQMENAGSVPQVCNLKY
jgi:hypothetical protein